MNKFKLTLLYITALTALASCKKEESITPETLQATELGISNQISALATAKNATYTSTNWMKFIPDNVSLSQLSIPGTHDAAARIEYFPGTAKCQNLSIAEQLNAGVRYLDIRCRHLNNAFVIHHGDVYQKLNFTDVITACYTFLKNNPSETILLCVKEEHTAVGNSRTFEQTFDSYTQQNPAKWDLSNTIQTLGNARGKIKLVRRFTCSANKGVLARTWGDNTTFDINGSAAKLRVQDSYQVTNLNTKWSQIQNLLTESRNDNSEKLYLNYTSGYKALLFGITSITTVSNSVNPKLDQYFSSNKKGKYGIVTMDFISAKSSKLIIDTNF